MTSIHTEKDLIKYLPHKVRLPNNNIININSWCKDKFGEPLTIGIISSDGSYLITNRDALYEYYAGFSGYFYFKNKESALLFKMAWC